MTVLNWRVSAGSAATDPGPFDVQAITPCQPF